jgi:polysaccharide pyruvyl transferase WcaK-like protein
MKTIQLTKDKIALVDDEDYEYLNQWKWNAYKKTDSIFYAARCVWVDKKPKNIYKTCRKTQKSLAFGM